MALCEGDEAALFPGGENQRVVEINSNGKEQKRKSDSKAYDETMVTRRPY